MKDVIDISKFNNVTDWQKIKDNVSGVVIRLGFGTVCGIISAAIYAFCEAWVDAARINSNTKQTITTTKKEVTE